ncbi:MAG TPA: enoyl-CoA hydratase-related protein [Phenylobacterium sp.]|nr:enoyl-CoA hydratase-related protein [Phenylobacterium sp.]
MSDETPILYAVEDRVCTITLNRPDRLNAWTPQMEADFRGAIERASADEAARAIVVTGAGRAFCAGADLGGGGRAKTELTPSDDDFDQRYTYLLKTPKPLIAAINGAAVGVGLCLTLYCDLRYAAEGAKLGTAFARRGLIAEHGAAWMLPRLIGQMNAMDLLLTGRNIDAAEAERMGLVRALPADGFLAAVTALARVLAGNASPRSLRIIKQQVREGFRQTLAEAVTLADREQLASLESEDFREGVRAFFDKRPPAFTGR